MHNLRDDINKTISIDNEMKNLQQNNGNGSNIKDFTIEECKIHFLEIHDKIEYEENINLLIEYCKSINITKINDISKYNN